ncbi:hypothetical protein B5G27_02635 [Lachnoclostridium sp. An76]|nr:hypothetical protein B5G27_02635 [Lachnoclostridium sp. An76]
MPAEGRENPLLKKGNSDAFFREKYLTKNRQTWKPLFDTLCQPFKSFCLAILLDFLCAHCFLPPTVFPVILNKFAPDAGY